MTHKMSYSFFQLRLVGRVSDSKQGPMIGCGATGIDMDTLTLFTIILAVTSIVLAVVSLVLSILFYVWSKRSNEDIQKSAIHIDHNTAEIQKLFDRFYSDTFGIMKNTVIAMQTRLFANTDSDTTKVVTTAEVSTVENNSEPLV